MLTECICEQGKDGQCPVLGRSMPRHLRGLCANDREYRAKFVKIALAAGKYTEPIMLDKVYLGLFPESRWRAIRKSVATFLKRFQPGNVLARIFWMIGLKLVVKRMYAKKKGGCGCSKRQNKLNRAWERIVEFFTAT